MFPENNDYTNYDDLLLELKLHAMANDHCMKRNERLNFRWLNIYLYALEIIKSKYLVD